MKHEAITTAERLKAMRLVEYIRLANELGLWNQSGLEAARLLDRYEAALREAEKRGTPIPDCVCGHLDERPK